MCVMLAHLICVCVCVVCALSLYLHCCKCADLHLNSACSLDSAIVKTDGGLGRQSPVGQLRADGGFRACIYFIHVHARGKLCALGAHAHCCDYMWDAVCYGARRRRTRTLLSVRLRMYGSIIFLFVTGFPCCGGCNP